MTSPVVPFTLSLVEVGLLIFGSPALLINTLPCPGANAMLLIGELLR